MKRLALLLLLFPLGCGPSGPPPPYVRPGDRPLVRPDAPEMKTQAPERFRVRFTVLVTHGIAGKIAWGSTYDSASGDYEGSPFPSPTDLGAGLSVTADEIVLLCCAGAEKDGRGNSLISILHSKFQGSIYAKADAKGQRPGFRLELITNLVPDSPEDKAVIEAWRSTLDALSARWGNTGVPDTSDDAAVFKMFRQELEGALESLLKQFKEKGLTEVYVDWSIDNYDRDFKKAERGK